MSEYHPIMGNLPCICPNEYSFEPHGDGFALYLGRCDHRHGYNLANMNNPVERNPRLSVWVSETIYFGLFA